MKNKRSFLEFLKSLDRKQLRDLAKKKRIRKIRLKSPAALRRAIWRAEIRKAQTEARKVAAIYKQRITQEADARYQEALKAYQEHRFRYLYAPSRFVHMGIHEEYLLEKDEDLQLPDFYLENELRLLPVDPWQYYVYWDFEPVLLEKVKAYLAQGVLFVLRSYDVTSIVFNGTNAHSSWDTVCHPLVREWYINSPVHDRHICVELGIMDDNGFSPLLRSNTVYIPSATVSPVRSDRFGQFLPHQEAATVVTGSQTLLSNPSQDVTYSSQPITQMSQQIANIFFRPYLPTPMRLEPRPQPRRIVADSVIHHTPENLVPPVFQPVPLPGKQISTQDSILTAVQASPLDISAASPLAQAESEVLWHQEQWSEIQDRGATNPKRDQEIIQFLGLMPGTEIRWFSEFPAEFSPLVFEQWITDPYDRMMFISYSIWPWEVTEYLPLGASDWTLRKFLGASLFSWYRPGGSERMLRWHSFPGASEGRYWLRPVGASERVWSGSVQPPVWREGNAWYAWPQSPRNPSGQGLFA